MCDGSDANLCIFVYQDLSIARQLELGIRYLSLDVCLLPDNCNSTSYNNLGNSRLVSCKGSDTDISFDGFAYGGSLVDILSQVDDWMRINTGEVIGIHFTRNQPVQDRAAVFSNLAPLLEMMWGEGTANSSSGNSFVSATEMSTYYTSNSNAWPSLGVAVEENERIFVFVDDELSGNSESLRPWINPTPFSTVAPEGFSFGSTCIESGILEDASRCNITTTDDADLVIATGYTLVACINDGQDSCNEVLENATERCYGLRQEGNRTVNIVLVDFPNRITTGTVAVFEIVSDLNWRNVLQYVGASAISTSDELVTTFSVVPGTSTAVSSDMSSGVFRYVLSTLLLFCFVMSSFVLS